MSKKKHESREATAIPTPVANAEATPAPDTIASSDGTLPPLSREEQVRLAAYLKAEARGFEPGQDLEDWVAAESEVDGKSAD